ITRLATLQDCPPAGGGAADVAHRKVNAALVVRVREVQLKRLLAIATTPDPVPDRPHVDIARDEVVVVFHQGMREQPRDLGNRGGSMPWEVSEEAHPRPCFQALIVDQTVSPSLEPRLLCANKQQ